MNYLLVEISNEQRVIPLSDVIRLEEFGSDTVEFSGDQEVVQYRDEIMVLKRVGPSDSTAPIKRRIQVVVVPHELRKVGLVVDRIVDIVQVDSKPNNEEKTMVINNRVTNFLDIKNIVVQ